MTQSLFERLVRFDQTRKSFPGEHWLALAAGLWFLKRKGSSLPSTLVSKAIGAAFVVRAASGRDGLQKLLKDTGHAGPGMDASSRPSLPGSSSGGSRGTDAWASDYPATGSAPTGSGSAGSASAGPGWAGSASTGFAPTGSALTGHPGGEAEDSAQAPQRAALLQPPEAQGDSAPESASRARAGGFPDFR